MKPTLQQSNSEMITQIIPPVKFYCAVSGKTLTATLTGILDNPLYFCYRIAFSNGYQDDFTLLEGGFVEGDKKKESAAYAFAIKDDLHALFFFSPDKEIYTMRWQIGDNQTNIWVIESQLNDEKNYKVYYNGDYRFEMIKKGAGWLAGTIRKIDPELTIDKLATEIGRMIDSKAEINDTVTAFVVTSLTQCKFSGKLFDFYKRFIFSFSFYSFSDVPQLQNIFQFSLWNIFHAGVGESCCG